MPATLAPDLFVVTDETTAADIAEAITHLAAYAKRQQNYAGNEAWARTHRRINALLHDWQARA